MVIISFYEPKLSYYLNFSKAKAPKKHSRLLLVVLRPNSITISRLTNAPKRSDKRATTAARLDSRQAAWARDSFLRRRI